MRRIAVLGLWFAVACVGRGTGGPAASTAALAAHDANEDALGLRVEALSVALTEQGFARSGPIVRGFLAPGARETVPVMVASGTSAMFVALTTPTMSDLDAALYRPDGQALVEDESSDARPTLVLCAGTEPISAYYALHAYQGAGAFAAAQFERKAKADDDLITAPPLDSVSPLADLAKVLHKRGFEDDAPRVEVSLENQDPVRVAVHVNAGDCYTLAAEAASGVHAIDLRLMDGGGHELVTGVGDPGLAALQYCADQTSDLALEVTARNGRGLAKVGRFRASQVSIGGVHALWLGEPSPTPRAWNSGTKTSAGAVQADLVEQYSLSQGRVLELAPKRALAACETWAIDLGPGLAGATMRVEDEQGHVLGEADAQQMHGELSLCNRQGPIRISLIGRSGFGTLTLTGRAGAQAHASAH